MKVTRLQHSHLSSNGVRSESLRVGRVPESQEAGVFLITPEIAEWIISERNPRNRHVTESLVRRLADDMEQGRWKLNGESLIFGDDGDLRDGQHRLYACVRSKIPFQTWIIFGVAPDVFDTIDRGNSRRTVDDFSIEGEHAVHCLVAALNILKLEEEGRLEQTGSRLFPSVVLKELLERHPEMRIAAKKGNSLSARRVLPPKIVCYLYYKFSQINPDARDTFFEDVASGANLEKHDPVLRLRNRLIENRSSKSRMKHPEILAIAVKAWNYRRQGRSSVGLKWNSASGETFPMPI